jgi:hypothetical protein
MYGTTSLREWLSGLSAGMAGLALICLALAFADADPGYFDPRPVLARVCRVLAPAGCASREAFRDAAALLLLLTTAPKGAMA